MTTRTDNPVWLFIVLLVALLSGSTYPVLAQGPATGPQTWIEYPLEGQVIPPEEPVSFVIYAIDPKEVAEIVLQVNGKDVPAAQPQAMSPDGSRRMVFLDQEWNASQEGKYLVEARGRNSAGVYGEPAALTFCIGSCQTIQTPTPAAMPSATDTPFPAITDTPRPLIEPTDTPRPAQIIPTDTPKPMAPVMVKATDTPTPAPQSAYNLYVRRMDFTPPNPNAGDTIQMAIMLATDTAPQGAPYYPASHFRWRQGANFPWNEESCPDNTQYASCVKNVNFSYSQPGSYVFEVEADHLQEVAETDETNNTRTWTIVVGQQQPPTPTFTPYVTAGYDLYVRRMDYVPPNPVAGSPIQMSIMLATDIAPQGAPYYPASHFRWRQGPNFPWNEEICPDNAQYASCMKTVTFSYAQPGSYVFEVQADHLSVIPETDENNNSRTWTIIVGQPQAPPPPPPASADINFRSDAPYVNAGGCTTLRWDVEGVREIYLDGQGVTGHGSQQVCPCQPSTYTLRVVKTDGSSVEQQVFIDVYGTCETQPPPSQPGGETQPPEEPAPSDSSGPDINGVGVIQSGCEFTGYATISDPSGVSWAQFHFQFDGGGWQSLWMADRGGGYWETEYPAQAAYNSGIIEFYVIASDNTGNQNESGTGSESYSCGETIVW